MQRFFFFIVIMYPFHVFSQWYSMIPYIDDHKKWGVMNLKSEVQIPAEYDSIGFFEDKWGMLFKQNGKYGLLKPTNKDKPIFVKPIYSSIVDTCNILILLNNKGTFYLNDTMKKVIPFIDDIYDQLNCLTENEEKRGSKIDNPNRFMNQKNFYLIQPDDNITRVNRNTFLTYHREGIPLTIIKKGSKKGIVITSFMISKQDDKSVWGKIESDTIPAIYDSLIINLCKFVPIKEDRSNFFSDKVDCIVAFRNNKWGIINTKTEILLPFVYEKIKLLENSESKYLLVQKGNLWGWIDTKTYQVVGECKYKSIERVSTKMQDLFFFVERPDGKKGYIGSQDAKEYIYK